MKTKKQSAFTLIEAVIVIVILAVAMTFYTTLLAPQFASSSDSHYYTRTSALAQSVMTNLLAQENNSDINVISSALDTLKTLDPSYRNFSIDNSSVTEVTIDGEPMQQITLIIEASNQPPITLTAFKGVYQ